MVDSLSLAVVALDAPDVGYPDSLEVVADPVVPVDVPVGDPVPSSDVDGVRGLDESVEM